MPRMRLYSVIFLLQEEKKRVYMEISFAADQSAVLRKHWRGDQVLTRDCFSRGNPDAKPEMLVWNIGYATRETANVFLKRWEEVFLQEGYELIGSQLRKEQKNKRVDLDIANRAKYDSISFANLMSGNGVKKIICGSESETRKSVVQRYSAETAEDILRVRTTYDVIKHFRKFCNEKQLTQNQGLALLLSCADRENVDNYLYQDLRRRLENADRVVREKEEIIQKLRRELQAEKESKKQPKTVRIAMLQNELLKVFFAKLPQPDFSEDQMKRWSKKQSSVVFPNKADYHFPEKEGVYLIGLEHIRHISGKPGLLMLYGRTGNEEKLKFCYRHRQEYHYGQSLWNSPYLIEGYPWAVAVYRTEEIAYIVGALPMFDLELIEDWYVEEEVFDPKDEIDEEMEPDWEMGDEVNPEPLWEANTPLERIIQIAEETKNKRMYI